MSEEKSYQLYNYSVFFHPVSCPLPSTSMTISLGHGCYEKQINFPNSAFSWHCRRGTRLYLVPSQTTSACEQETPKKQLKTSKEGEEEVLVVLGGQKVFRTLLRDLCAHWALQGELFYKQVTLVNTDWVWPSCKQLCSIEQWDHGPSHEGSLTPEVAYPNTVSLGCLGKHFQSVTVKLLKGFIWEEIFLSEQGGH